jgi:predicted RNA binding protein YcfA (HicA-like mRNA interferase family)
LQRSWVNGDDAIRIILAGGGYGVDFLRAMVMITTMNSKQIIKQLEADGWTLRGVKGSHHIFTHPSKPGHISVPHPKQDLGVGLVHKLLKQAGLK